MAQDPFDQKAGVSHATTRTPQIVIEGDVTVKSIDRAVWRARREFPSLAWQAVVSAVEAAAVEQNRERLSVKGCQKRLFRRSCDSIPSR